MLREDNNGIVRYKNGILRYLSDVPSIMIITDSNKMTLVDKAVMSCYGKWQLSFLYSCKRICHLRTKLSCFMKRDGFVFLFGFQTI